MTKLKIYLKDMYLRTKYIILESDIDFVQLTLSFLYGFAFMVFLNNYLSIFQSYPFDFQVTYLFLIQAFHPLVWCGIFFVLWFVSSYDCLNLNHKHKRLKLFYLFGPFLWLYLAVGVLLDFGLILTVGVYFYLFSHSTWLYFRY